MDEAFQPQPNIHHENINILTGGSGTGHAYPSLISEDLRNSEIFRRTVGDMGSPFAAEILSFLRNEFSNYGYRDEGSRNGHDWEEAVRSLLSLLGIRYDPNVRAGKSEVDFLIFTSKGKVLLEVKLAIRDNHNWQVEKGKELSQKLGCPYVVAVGQVEASKAIASILA